MLQFVEIKKIIALLGFLTLGYLVHGQDPIKKNFKVYNALLFKNTPDLTNYGFSKINMVYEDGVISTNYHVTDLKDTARRFIDYPKIAKAASSAKASYMVPTCLDVEHWSLYDKKNYNYAVNKYVDLIKSYRKVDYNSLVSVFHYGSISQDIYNSSNVIYPCYYTHSSNINEWIAMVKNSILKIKKFGGKKPIYAFIWPQYNPEPGRNDLGYTFIDREMWKIQLETIYNLCDGVIIWSHYRDQNGNNIYFDVNMPWFQETLSFIKRHKIKS